MNQFPFSDPRHGSTPRLTRPTSTHPAKHRLPGVFAWLLIATLLLFAAVPASAAEMYPLRARLVSRLQAAGYEVHVGAQPAFVYENDVAIAFESGGRLVSAFVKPSRGEDYTPKLVAPRFNAPASDGAARGIAC